MNKNVTDKKMHVGNRSTVNANLSFSSFLAVETVILFLFIFFHPANPLIAQQQNKPPKTVVAKPPQQVSLPVLKNKNGETIRNSHGQPFILGDGGTANFTHYTSDNGLALDVVISSYSDHYGNLWFGTAGGGISRYDGKTFTNYTTAHGLAKNTVWCIFEDSKANIWIGSGGGGINKFDGTRFINYTVSSGLVSNVVRGITEDNSGNIWFATDGGLSVLKAKEIGKNKPEFINYTTEQGLSNNSIRSIVQDKNGTIWIATFGGGINILHPQNGPVSFKTFTKRDGLLSDNLLCLFLDRSGTIWAGTDNGASHILTTGNKLAAENFTRSQGLINNSVWSILQDKQNELWFGTQGGVSRLQLIENNRMEPELIFTSYTVDQGLSSNNIKTLVEDKDGSIWICTYGGGLNRYDGKAFTNYNTRQGLPGNIIWSILEDQKGNIWFGTNNNGVSCYDGNVFKNYSTAQGLPDSTVWSMYTDKGGNIWFGTDGKGLCIFNGNTFTTYTTEQGLSNNTVRCIYEDSHGTIWLGTLGGISRFNPHPTPGTNSYFTNYTTADGLAANTIWKIFEDSKNNLWIGTFGGGLSLLNRDTKRTSQKLFTNFTTKDGLPNNTICSIVEDKDGILWIGTAGGGLSRFDGDSFLNFNKPQGLPNAVVTQLLMRPNKYTAKKARLQSLIAGTNQGLAVLTGWKDANDQFYPGLSPDGLVKANEKLTNKILKNYTPVFEVYNSETGYPVKDVNGGQDAIYQDSKGNIWIATGADKTGLVRFNPSELNRNKKAPVLLIQSIKVNEETVCWHCITKAPNDSAILAAASQIEEVSSLGSALTQEQREAMRKKFAKINFDAVTPFYPLPQHLVLPYENNSLSFEFGAVEPVKFKQIRYQYILEGYSNQWSPLSSKTTATFGNMYEGDYTFRLKALSSEGVWSTPVTYSFTVLPPFYRTWWAYSIYAVVVSAILFILYRWRTASLRKDKELLESTVKERTSEIIKQKKLVEEKNSLITDSIEYAQNIQQAILPSEEELKKCLPEYFVLYKPKDIVSGDFYWVHEDKERIFIAVADCTGHGVPGAFMSLLGSNFLNDIIKIKAQHTPSEILEELNIQVLTSLKQNSNNTSVKYGMDIALICFDKAMTTLQYAGAHSPLLIFRKQDNNSQEPEFFQLKADKRSIGSIKKAPEQGFTNHTFQLVKGDVMYLFSDGFADQLGGPERKKFFSQTFKALLQSNCHLGMDQQQQILEKTIFDWKGDLNQTDDILVVGIKI
ncbi:MAG: two-component regulator propeller domain-containing protein [Bacteroidia bacterium]